MIQMTSNLDGETKDAFTESVRARYDAYGWHTDLVTDGTDVDAILQLLKKAKAAGKPSLIEIKTVIGYGSPSKAGSNALTVLLLVQKRQKQLVRHLIGTMLHLKFQLKSMRTSKLM